MVRGSVANIILIALLLEIVDGVILESSLASDTPKRISEEFLFNDINPAEMTFAEDGFALVSTIDRIDFAMPGELPDEDDTEFELAALGNLSPRAQILAAEAGDTYTIIESNIE